MLLLDITGFFSVMNGAPLDCDGMGHISTSFFPLRGLTFPKKCAKFLLRKALTKTCAPVRFPERTPFLVKGTRSPAAGDTTSELQVGNVLPGAPVTASMSGSVKAGQPGWNRGILLTYCIPPLILQGMGIFYTFPN